MKKYWKRMGLVCIIFCLLLQGIFFQTVLVHGAASASVKFSSSTVKVGDTVTATVTVSGGGVKLGALEGNITYNTSMLSFIDENADGINESTKGTIILVPTPSGKGVDSFSFQLKFKALKAGSATLQVKTAELVSASESILPNVSANKSVEISNISKEAALKALTVSAGSLSPKFAEGTTAYTVNVANTVTSVTVKATPKDANAKVTGTGATKLSVGKNTITVKVTAEDGKTVKTYTVTVNREAATAKPTKEPTKSPEKTPTPTGNSTGTPSDTGTATTPDTSPTGDEPTAPATDATDSGETETPTLPATGTDMPGPTETPTESVGTVSQSPAKQEQPEYNGLFTVQAAFAFCAVGMFLVGGTVGFLLCYVIKSKANKK